MFWERLTFLIWSNATLASTQLVRMYKSENIFSFTVSPWVSGTLGNVSIVGATIFTLFLFHFFSISFFSLTMMTTKKCVSDYYYYYYNYTLKELILFDENRAPFLCRTFFLEFALSTVFSFTYTQLSIYIYIAVTSLAHSKNYIELITNS